MMKIIALTGGIGAGKSLVLHEFEKRGADVIDTDKVSHELMMHGGIAYDAVVENFGIEILSGDNEIDRKALGAIVFSDKEKLELLNSIMHKLIYAETERRISLSEAELVCVEIPLLFTAECPIKLDMKIAVVADRELRIRRVMERDGCTREQAEERMARQLDDEELRRLADFVIENNGSPEDLRRQIDEILSGLIMKRRKL